MTVHRDVPRTAAFAWSPGPQTPLIATGTKAGAVDADFTSDTVLELWDLDLGGPASAKELQPLAQINTDSRFHDIAWVQPKSEHSRGLIAGGLENGSLDLWDAQKLLDKQEEALTSRTTKHTGAIKALQFNPFRPDLLATAGAKGELYISDLNKIGDPFRLGTNAGRADDFECLDWNKQVPHIMVTGSSSGFVTVWDVKSKKESLTLNNNGRKAVSAVAWDPEKSTRVITAVPLDSDPLILVWDLRNSNAPEKILRGHEGGVLSLSWCRSDHDLLLSCGKDNRTICWNPQTGDAYGDFPVVTNWTFQTRWNPHNPGLLATASFDGKIAVRSIQNTSTEQLTNTNSQSLEGADFFDKASSQPQTSSFSLLKAPKWLESPTGASFGFGGKLISVNQVIADGKPTRKSVVRISSFTVDSEISDVTAAFAKSMSEGDLKQICESHIQSSTLDTETNDWKVIETLLESQPRQALVRHLGIPGIIAGSEPEKGESDADIKKPGIEDDDGTFFDQQDSGENLLPRLASSKGVKSNIPFHILTESDNETDKEITRALMQGKFMQAMDACLEQDRLSDALMIAISGGAATQEKVKQAYFKKRASGPNYIRLLASINGGNLEDIVQNADLSNWKEVMAALCTYAAPNEFELLCEALGDRLEEQSQSGSDADQLRQSASFCYIAGSNLEKVVGLWIADLQRHEEASLKSATSGSSFSIHATALQSFIEKVTIFRAATNYKDDGDSEESSKLAPLYERYIEYADIASAHGQLQVAEQYLKLLPKSYQVAQTARDRVQQATKPATKPTAQQSIPSRPAQGYMPPMPPQQTMGQMGAQNQFGANPFAQPNPAQSAVQYSPAAPYSAPSPYQPQAPNPYQMQPQGLARPMMAHSMQGPPRSMNASPSIPPPSQDRAVGNWNDLPEGFGKAPTPRRGTPTVPPPNAQAAPPSQQPYAPQITPTSAFGQQPLRAQPPPPPPKGPAPPPRTGNTPQPYMPPERPSSTSNNYNPPPGSQAPPAMQTMGQIPRGPSPYNPPPQNSQPSTTSNRYAPAPAPMGSQQGPPAMSQRSPPPPNPYASPPSISSQLPGPPPMGAPPMGGPPPSGGPPPQAAGGAINAPPPAAPPASKAASKHPSGDRTHIPKNAQPIFELLSADMQRVKAKAPASFKVHVTDTEKRLNILFDHLNNETLLKEDTITDMVSLSEAIRDKDYDRAMQIHLDIIRTRNDECTNWMTGVKRLISMSRATPA